MADRESKVVARANRNMQNIAKDLDADMAELYRNTYMSGPEQRNDLKNLSDRINASIDGIVARNQETLGTPSISKLYSRLSSAPGELGSDGRKFMQDLQTMFNQGIVSDDLYGMFMSNRYLKELDNEIDTVCKYMPKLDEALQVQQDCVISADHFSKDFLTFKYLGASSEQETLFAERAKDLKRKYKLQEFVEDVYRHTSRYGEDFVYRVPYATAIGQLLSTKPDGQFVSSIRGSGINEGVITEQAYPDQIAISWDNKSLKAVTESGEILINDSYKANSGLLQGDESFKLVLEFS